MLVDTDVAAVNLHAQGFQAKVLDIAVDADGDDGDLGFQRLCLAADLDGDGDAGLGLGQFRDLGAHAELQAAPFERLASGGRDLLVLHRKDAVEGFYHRNFGA